MTHHSVFARHVALAVGLFACITVVSATQPPDLVKSDAKGNTAKGTDVLLNLGPYSEFNTAAGFNSMFSGGGISDTAFGIATLNSENR